MSRPIVWLDSDLTNVHIKADHIHNYRDFVSYLEDDFCLSHNSGVNASAYTTDDSADNITVRSTHNVSYYSTKYTGVETTNCGSAYSTHMDNHDVCGLG